jgi:hypothetical protein
MTILILLRVIQIRIQIVMTTHYSPDSGSGSHSGIVDKACRLINNHPRASMLLGHALGLGTVGTLAQGYCGLIDDIPL